MSTNRKLCCFLLGQLLGGQPAQCLNRRRYLVEGRCPAHIEDDFGKTARMRYALLLEQHLRACKLCE